MAQSITLQGATYPDVPAVDLPKTGGGTARFTDVSDTTARVVDVAVGSYFYTSAGVKKEGTADLAVASVSGTVLTLTDGFPIYLISPNI